jgi:tetratricopeptide (TPR) repeat protein
MTLKEWDDAIKEFEAYNKRQPGDIMIRQPWAQAVFNASNYAGAAEILAPVLTAQPNNPDVLLLHANILAKIGDREEAKAVAARANELNRKRVEERRNKAPQPPSDKAPAPQAPAPPE